MEASDDPFRVVLNRLCATSHTLKRMATLGTPFGRRFFPGWQMDKACSCPALK